MATDFGFEPTKNKFYYFISYNSEDNKRVGEIASQMMSQGIPVWYDKGIYPDDIWSETIAAKLDKCEKIIVFVTKNLVKKALGENTDSFVQKEYELAKRLNKSICFVFLDKITEQKKKEVFSDIGKYKKCKFLEVHDITRKKIIVDQIKRNFHLFTSEQHMERTIFFICLPIIIILCIISLTPGYVTLSYEMRNNQAVVTGYTINKNPYGIFRDEPIYKIKVPSKINGYPVTKIDKDAFSSEGLIYKIHISADIISIGDGAFSNCYNLETIELPDSLIYIGDHTFENCDSLETIVLPDSVTHIGKHSFDNCDSLETVRLPGNLEKISEYCFYNCGNLKEIYLPQKLKLIEEYAFAHSFAYPSVKASVKELVIPEGVEKISNYAFADSRIRSIKFPPTIKSIGMQAFSKCSRLEKISLPESVTDVGERCFEECNDLNIVELSPNLKQISTEMFYSCYNIEQVIIPYGIETINDRAFFYCKKLSNISIPDSVKVIGDGAFAGTSPIHIDVPNSTTHIGAGAFYSFSLESIYLPDSVVEIGEGIINQDYDATIDVIFECSSNSMAYRYAKENNIKVILR